MLNQTMPQKTNAITLVPEPNGNAINAFAATQAETTLLFADTVKSFESMSEGDSGEFLEQCRQTGGE